MFSIGAGRWQEPYSLLSDVVLAISQHIVFEDSCMQELCLGYVLVVCGMLENRGQGRLDSPRR